QEASGIGAASFDGRAEAETEKIQRKARRPRRDARTQKKNMRTCTASVVRYTLLINIGEGQKKIIFQKSI
ncbi:MAG: hypothetical protein IKY27_00555, partial [Bacteroidales bacterium]|nr:hypothetical protein [Bacteroidales bacterium]